MADTVLQHYKVWANTKVCLYTLKPNNALLSRPQYLIIAYSVPHQKNHHLFHSNTATEALYSTLMGLFETLGGSRLTR